MVFRLVTVKVFSTVSTITCWRTFETCIAVPDAKLSGLEKDDGGVFRDPVAYPRGSVATTGTHDTSALATWWEDELAAEPRRALADVASFAALRGAGREFTPEVHAALLDGLYAAGSDLVVIPFPDAYGGRERINVPATTGAHNWSYRLPWSLPELAGAGGDALAARLRALATGHGRA